MGSSAMEKVDSASERFGFDAICAFVLLLTALLGAYCPKYLSQQPGHQANGRSLAFSLGNMLSGGVMLSAGFCHLLADSLQIMVFIGRFPITTFLAAVGFIITLCADQVVQHFSEDDDEQHPPLLEQKSDEANIGLTVLPPAKSISPSTPKERHCAGAHNHDTADSMPILDAAAARSTGGRYRPLHEGAGTSSDWHDHGNHMKAFLSHKPLAFATSVLLAAALCVHSILEGMALGAQRSIKGSEDIMIAIVAHKGLAAYALGSSVIDSKVSAKKFWTVVGLFALATPVGIFTGYGLAELSSGSGAAALSALASGTFLYVAMMEVIPKELEESRHRLLKMTSLLLGFGLMSMLAIWA